VPLGVGLDEMLGVLSTASLPLSTCNVPRFGRLVIIAHCGCPSAVMKDASFKPFENVITSSGSPSVNFISATVAPTSLFNIPRNLASELKLPPRIDLAFSILQLHSIITDTSPSGFRFVPSLRIPLSRRVPNSRNMADPNPRQTCETGIPIRTSRNSECGKDLLPTD
jgi:hypothetical protein